MDEAKKTAVPETAPEQKTVPAPETKPEAAPAPVSAEENKPKDEPKKPAPKKPEPEYFTLKAKPPKKKPKEDVEAAKKIANRYLGIQALEKIVNAKKARQKKKAAQLRFKPPETPEEFYERGQKYASGADCAVSFQERALYLEKAADMFTGAGEYSDSSALAQQYAALAEQVRTEGYEHAYAEAQRLKEHAISSDDWFEAARTFERISGYRDADQLAQECEHTLTRRASMKKPLTVLLILLIAGLLFAGVSLFRTDRFHYQLARTAHALGLDSVATAFLNSDNDYGNSEQLLDEIYYNEGQDYFARKKYKRALSSFEKCSEDYPQRQLRLDECNYALGEKAFAEGHNKQAKDYFKACSKGYKDRAQRIDECNYHQGIDAMEEQDYAEAVSHFLASHNFADAAALRLEPELILLDQAKPGDKVYFGTAQYILLDRQDQICTLLSCKLAGALPYHHRQEPVTWEESTLRSALNSQEYLDERFSADEQALIQQTPVEHSTDRLYLLSREEYLLYQSVMGGKDALWWLRDNGDAPDTAIFVSDEGAVMEAGYPVNSTEICGRAALRVALPEQ